MGLALSGRMGSHPIVSKHLFISAPLQRPAWVQRSPAGVAQGVKRSSCMAFPETLVPSLSLFKVPEVVPTQINETGQDPFSGLEVHGLSPAPVCRKWEGGDPGVANQKTPTSLLLTPEGVFHSFGYTARDYYHDLDPEEARDWLYFEKFKMKIHSTSVSPCSDPDLPRGPVGTLARLDVS